jgi:NAD(P)-dependent dehydrogenase (short-subunit alcohol dehydrogenase family)
MSGLEGRRVLVVGGSSGIGLGIAQVAASAGAQVTIASRSQEKLDAALKSIEGAATARVLDASKDADVETFFSDGKAWDHVVTSAGMGGRGTLPNIEMKTAYAAMDAKFWVYFRVARAAKIATGGTLTFVSGSLGTKAAFGSALVSATNAAVEALARGLALDLAPVRVNVISPGVVDTPLWNQFSEERRKEFFATTSQKLPARRIGQPRDIGHAVVFAMTNPFLTGQIIQVDGGSGILPGTGH